MVKMVEYRGIVYRRYEGRLYYNPNGSVLANGGTSLHRQIWLDAGREIPPRWHIHHIDGDHDHNELANFECLPPGKHGKHHHEQRINGELGAALAAWRASPGGKATLRANGYKMLERMPLRRFACGNCGTLRRVCARLLANMPLAIGKFAERVRSAVSSSGAEEVRRNRPKPAHIVAVGRSDARKPVFNLTVVDAHLFYANGVLSSNTATDDHLYDCTRYGLQALKLIESARPLKQRQLVAKG